MCSELCTDDFIELARVEQKRLLAASRIKSRPDPALLSMFASTMQLAQKGKITHKNAFQLQLIDHMADIIQQPDDTEAATSRQTPQRADRPHISATGTPLSTAPAFATPSTRSPTTAVQSKGSPDSVQLSPTSRQPSSLADITNQQRRPAVKPQVNFVKASSTLDASVMIYSGRVDNVHKDAYRMAGGLTAQQLEREEEVADDEADDEQTEQASRARKKRRAAATIEVKLSNINMKQMERREDGDPFFKRMSAAFDAGGASGLLTHQLSVYRGAELALDGQLSVLQARQEQTVDGLTQHFDLTELSELLTRTASNWRQLTVCPLMRELEAVRDELLGKPALTDDDSSSTPESGESAIPFNDAAYNAALHDDKLNDGFADLELTAHSTSGAAVCGGVDLSELHAEIDAAIAQEQCLDSQMAGATDDLGDDNDDDNTATDVVSPTANSTAVTFSYIAPGLFGAPTDNPTASFSSQSHMAAMAHWKFKSNAAPLAASTQRQPRQTKATASLDFYAAAPPSSAFAIITKKRLNTLRLSVATLRKRMEPSARAALMRPTAATYRVEGLVRLYGRDNSVSIRSKLDERAEERKQMESADETAVEAEGFADAWDDMAEDDDDGAAAFNAMDATVHPPASNDAHSDFTLLTKPKQVEQLSIGYAQVAKRVDVKRLKECLWSGINTDSATAEQRHAAGEDSDSNEWEKPANRATIAPVTFQHAIDTLAGRYPASQLAAVSVPYCFICVLHLCNEQGLVLESDLLPPSHTAASEEASVRRMNLSSFTIKAAQ